MDYMKLVGGYIFPESKDFRNYKYSAIVNRSANNITYPCAFRLWTLNIKNQKDKQTCVAHAMATIKETQEYYDTGAKKEISTAWYYGCRTDDQYQGEGMHITECLYNARKFGGLYISEFPENYTYENAKKIARNEWNAYLEKAAKLKIKNYVELSTNDEIKSAIYNDKSPVLIGMGIFENFAKVSGDGILADLQTSDLHTYYGGHAMAIIGWTIIDDKEYWIVQNSWGTEWGANGIVYIPTTYIFNEKYSVMDVANYEKNLQDIRGRWSEERIKKCIRAGVINGYEDGTFKPLQSLTREQFCSAISKLLDLMA